MVMKVYVVTKDGSESFTRIFANLEDATKLYDFEYGKMDIRVRYDANRKGDERKGILHKWGCSKNWAPDDRYCITELVEGSFRNGDTRLDMLKLESFDLEESLEICEKRTISGEECTIIRNLEDYKRYFELLMSTRKSRRRNNE